MGVYQVQYLRAGHEAAVVTVKPAIVGTLK